MLFVKEVRKRKRGTTRVTSKHQLTIPTAAMREAGVRPGDRLTARADGVGRIVFEREVDPVAELAGSMPGVWQPGDLDALRGEWER